MSVLITTSIAGISTPVDVDSEYTSTAVGNAYQDAITQIGNVFTAIGVSTAANPTNLVAPTGADADTINNAINALLSLAQNGIANPNGNAIQVPDPNNPGQTITEYVSFLTLDMGQSTDLLVKSLQAVGFFSAYQTYQTTQDPTAVINALEQWKDLSDAGLSTIMENAVDAVSANRSLQAMVELDYVSAGNDQINSQLSSLNEALTATQDSLNLLQQIQDLKNDINIVPINPSSSQSFVAFVSGNPAAGLSDNEFSSIDAYSSAYKSVADSLFNNPLTVTGDANPNTPIPAGGTGVSFSSAQLASYANFPGQLTQLIGQLQQLSPSSVNDPSSLASELQLVLNDMQGKSLEQWLNDNLDSATATNSGAIQQHITDAITAGTSLNDTQKQTAQQQLYVFEEFYKSASDVLTAISQIIVSMAQGIRGQ